jgi:hypothetical protein
MTRADAARKRATRAVGAVAALVNVVVADDFILFVILLTLQVNADATATGAEP